MKDKISISGCIIALNEGRRIGRAIKSLKNCVDETIVIDGGSKDNTVTIAKELNAKVFTRIWDNNFGKQRNFAIEKANSEWILMLDSDEVISPDLCKKICLLVKEKEADGYVLTRKNYIDKKLVQSKYKTDFQLRLFRRFGRYETAIHEKPIHLKEIIEPIFSSREVIYHYKSSVQQKKHLVYQKEIMEDQLMIAEKKKDLAEIDRLKRNLANWNIWWEDANFSTGKGTK